VHEAPDGTLQTSFSLNPHTNVIHKVMPFKRTFSGDIKLCCFFEIDTMATGGADLRPMSAPPGSSLPLSDSVLITAMPRVTVRVVVP
jgi:hypothetical protein